MHKINARNREFLKDVTLFVTAALTILLIAAALSGCATDCTYKAGMTCYHIG